jgi:hypothetical protein
MECQESRLVSIQRPRQEPVELPLMVQATSRELCRQVLWQYELTEQVLCIPEQGQFPQGQPCRLLLVARTEDHASLSADIAQYIAALAPGGFVLAYPYSHERPDVQDWVHALLLNDHYAFLGQVGQLIALQAPVKPTM